MSSSPRSLIELPILREYPLPSRTKKKDKTIHTHTNTQMDMGGISFGSGFSDSEEFHEAISIRLSFSLEYS